MHVFEDRYKQLINDCRSDALTFGIPVYIDNRLEYGTEVQLVEVVTTYGNGEMDVACVARQVFKLLTFEDRMGDRLYSGGEVRFMDTVDDADLSAKQSVLDDIAELYGLMGVPFSGLDPAKFNSYMLAHKIGLSLAQEYELLKCPEESRRLDYLKRHLQATIAVLKEVERTKRTIALNGNFKHFDPLDFKGLIQ